MSPFRLTLRDPGGDGPSPSQPGCPTTPCPSRTHPTKSCSVLLTPRRARKTRRVSMVGGSRAQPRAGTEPPRCSGSLPELLTGAASAAPAASAATNRAGRKGSQSPNVCFIWQSQHKSSQIREDLITSPSVSGSWMSVPVPAPSCRGHGRLPTHGRGTVGMAWSQEPQNHKETPLCFHGFLDYTLL